MTFYLLITHPPVYADVPSVRPFVCYKSRDNDILKVNELISLQIGTSCPHRARKWKGQFSDHKVKGQGHTPQSLIL